MDGGSFRTPRRADEERMVAKRQEPVHQQPKEPQPAKEEPKPVYRPAHHRPVDNDKPWKRFILPIVVLVVVIILGVGSWAVWSNTQNAGATAIDSSKYQAVFFTNGQVYFGKLHTFNNEYMKLTDIYYLQTQSTSDPADSKNPQKTTNDQNNPTLIKLGDEIHGPEDEMIVSKNQMLFYENLKSDGKVAQSIDKYKNGSK